jgi:hypothetical protein
MENKNGSKWQPVTTQWREGQYEAIGANGARLIIDEGQQFDRIAKARGKNPLCRLIDPLQVYHEMQKPIQERQE